VLLAGAGGPEALGTVQPGRAATRLAETACVGPSDSLHVTLARACEISGPSDTVLVLTDRPPAVGEALRPGVRWLAFGSVEANAGIAYADRSVRGDGTEALLIEIASFARPEKRVPVRVVTSEGGTTLFADQVDTGDGGTGRLVIDLPPETPAVTIELPADALATDNRAVLIPETPRPVTVAVRVDDTGLRRTVERALTATGRIRLDGGPPQLVFTDRAQDEPDAPWQVVFTIPEAPRLLRGPYLADRSHPLLEGISCDGLVWPAGTNVLPGHVLLFAGSVPLLSVDAGPRRAPVIHLVTAGANDALYRTTAWPALVWNLVQLCAETQPGPPARNIRAGMTSTFTTARGATESVFETPRGTLTLRARGGRTIWTPTVPGRYGMRMPDGRTEPFAVTIFAPGESDLSGRMSGRWEGPQDDERLRRTHRSFAWLAGLIALLLIGIHHSVVWRGGKGL